MSAEHLKVTVVSFETRDLLLGLEDNGSGVLIDMMLGHGSYIKPGSLLHNLSNTK